MLFIVFLLIPLGKKSVNGGYFLNDLMNVCGETGQYFCEEIFVQRLDRFN